MQNHGTRRRDHVCGSEAVDFDFQISSGETFVFADRLDDCPNSDSSKNVEVVAQRRMNLVIYTVDLVGGVPRSTPVSSGQQDGWGTA